MSKLNNSNMLEIKQLHLIISICRRELSWHLCAHTNGKLTINATQFGLKLNIWLEFQTQPVWEERGGGKSLSTHVRLSTSSQQFIYAIRAQSATEQHRCHGILQVKGFFIRFKIEPLWACFWQQQEQATEIEFDGNAIWTLWFMLVPCPWF